jgi:predicted RNase H-like nuclease (RuvC/YqgF family)
MTEPTSEFLMSDKDRLIMNLEGRVETLQQYVQALQNNETAMDASIGALQSVVNDLMARAIREDKLLMRFFVMLTKQPEEIQKIIQAEAKKVVQTKWKPSDGLAANPEYRDVG